MDWPLSEKSQKILILTRQNAVCKESRILGALEYRRSFVVETVGTLLKARNYAERRRKNGGGSSASTGQALVF